MLPLNRVLGLTGPRAGLHWLCIALQALLLVRCSYVFYRDVLFIVAAAAATVLCCASCSAPVCQMATGFALQRSAANSTVAQATYSRQANVRGAVLLSQ